MDFIALSIIKVETSSSAHLHLRANNLISSQPVLSLEKIGKKKVIRSCLIISSKTGAA